MVEDKLYDKLLSLPRIMRSSSDDQKLVVLNILLGYFNLLGDKLADILTSISVLEKLIKSFIQVSWYSVFRFSPHFIVKSNRGKSFSEAPIILSAPGHIMVGVGDAEVQSPLKPQPALEVAQFSALKRNFNSC